MNDLTIRKVRNRFRIIEEEISNLVEEHYVFNKYKDYIENSKNVDKENYFLFFIAFNYQKMAIINVTKQIDEDARSESLVNLLKDLKQINKALTMKWFLRNHTKWLKRKGEEEFKKFSISNNSKASIQKIDEDTKKLKKTIKGLRFGGKKQSVESIQKYRNKRLAHFDKGSPKINLKWNKVEKAIKLLEELVIKYNLLLFQTGIADNTLLSANIDQYINFTTIFKT